MKEDIADLLQRYDMDFSGSLYALNDFLHKISSITTAGPALSVP